MRYVFNLKKDPPIVVFLKFVMPKPVETLLNSRLPNQKSKIVSKTVFRLAIRQIFSEEIEFHCVTQLGQEFG